MLVLGIEHGDEPGDVLMSFGCHGAAMLSYTEVLKMMTHRWYTDSPLGRRAILRALGYDESAGAHQALGEERDDPQDAPARDRWEAWSNACSEEERRLYEGGDALDEGGDALVARSRSRTPTSQRSPSPSPAHLRMMATLIEAGASDLAAAWRARRAAALGVK